jgi:hypothetical protein
VAIEVLSAWRVLRNETPILFERLGRIRNRLIHFSPDLYGNERAIALEALTILSSAVNLQFGFFSAERWWAIKGTKGAQFIATDAERDPFIRKFYLPRSPVVGPHYAIDIRPEGYAFFDRSEYPSGEISDENFAELRAGSGNLHRTLSGVSA